MNNNNRKTYDPFSTPAKPLTDPRLDLDEEEIDIHALQRQRSESPESEKPGVVTIPPAQKFNDFNNGIMLATFVLYALVVIWNNPKDKKEFLYLSDSIAIPVFTNIQVFLEDELMHLLCCMGFEKHEPPLPYWYRLSTIVAEFARIPLLYTLQQKIINTIQEPLYSEDNQVQNFMLLMTGYVLLHCAARGYSELINPSVLLSEKRRNLLFNWSETPRKYVPTSPISSPSPCKEYRGSGLTPPSTPFREKIARIFLAPPDTDSPATDLRNLPKSYCNPKLGFYEVSPDSSFEDDISSPTTSKKSPEAPVIRTLKFE